MLSEAVLAFATPYKITFNSYGFQAVVNPWAKNGFKKSVDEVCNIIIELIGEY